MASEQLLVRLNMDATRYNAQARTAAANTAAVGTSAKTTARATGGLGAKMKGLATGGGGLLAVAGGAIAVKGAFEGTVGAFASFDDAMTQSLAIMGDVSDEMRTEMSDAAREVAKETTFSAEQAAEAYFFLASAGLDATASVEAMPAVAQFAQAGMFDLAQATDLATDAQSALGLASDDAEENLENLTRVTDVFTKANTLANTSVEQVAEAMTSRAGAALRALNKDVEEGAAVLAALADQGVKGSEAGTQLGIVLRDLQTRALENADAFEEAGISVFDAQGNMRNIADVLSDVEGRMDGMSDAQKRAELSALGFSDRSIAVLTTLLGTSDAIREYEEELRNAGGTTEEVADKQLESAAKQFELFKSEIADIGLEIGEELLPALQEMLPLLQGGADLVSNIDFSLVTAQAKPLIDALTLLNGLIGESGDEAEDASIGSQILGEAWQGLLDFANPLGAAYRGINELLGETEEEKREAADAASELTDAEIAARDAFADLAPAASDAAESIESVGGASGSSAGEVEVLTGRAGELGGAWDDVITSMENYEDMLRRLTDPVFAAIDDQAKLEEATQKYLDVIDDPESTVGEQERAVLDLVKAQQAAEESAADLPDDLQVAADHIAILGDRAGIADEDLRKLKDRIMEFDGLTAQSTISINVVGGERVPGDMNRDVVLRHSGGPGRAGEPYRIRPDEEIFVPSGNGEFLLNNEVIDALKGLSSNSNTTTTNNYNIPVQSTGDHNTDAQLVSSITSVLRRMETL